MLYNFLILNYSMCQFYYRDNICICIRPYKKSGRGADINLFLFCIGAYKLGAIIMFYLSFNLVDSNWRQYESTLQISVVTSLVSLQNVLVIFSSIGRVFCSFNLSPFFFPTRQKCVKHKRDVSWGFEYRASVVYFDQQAHACACICMVEKGKR